MYRVFKKNVDEKLLTLIHSFQISLDQVNL